uniref:Hexosyltransferase n=1 Tax=Oryza brachyantha TaxID=4533 RepID=J3MUV4_ORYBR
MRQQQHHDAGDRQGGGGRRGLPEFFGIFTCAHLYERRALLRMAYALQPRPRRAAIDVRFVMCRLDKEEDAVLVALEIITHNDILVLNCTENMNDGKTYEYFSSLPRLFAAGSYDYAGKIDDDTYYRLEALGDTLRRKARRDMGARGLEPRPPPPGRGGHVRHGVHRVVGRGGVDRGVAGAEGGPRRVGGQGVRAVAVEGAEGEEPVRRGAADVRLPGQGDVRRGHLLPARAHGGHGGRAQAQGPPQVGSHARLLQLHRRPQAFQPLPN